MRSEPGGFLKTSALFYVSEGFLCVIGVIWRCAARRSPMHDHLPHASEASAAFRYAMCCFWLDIPISFHGWGLWTAACYTPQIGILPKVRLKCCLKHLAKQHQAYWLIRLFFSHCAQQTQTIRFHKTSCCVELSMHIKNNHTNKALSYCAPFLITGFSEHRQPFRSQNECFPGSKKGNL